MGNFGQKQEQSNRFVAELRIGCYKLIVAIEIHHLRRKEQTLSISENKIQYEK